MLYNKVLEFFGPFIRSAAKDEGGLGLFVEEGRHHNLAEVIMHGNAVGADFLEGFEEVSEIGVADISPLAIKQNGYPGCHLPDELYCRLEGAQPIFSGIEG